MYKLKFSVLLRSKVDLNAVVAYIEHVI